MYGGSDNANLPIDGQLLLRPATFEIDRMT